MNSSATIRLWNKVLGYIVWDDKRSLGYFEFEQDFLSHKLDVSPIVMPISLALDRKLPYSFPTLEKKVFNGLPGLMSDSLPDMFGNKVIEVWKKYSQFQSKELNPVDRLCFMGNRTMGALEYEPHLSIGFSNSDQIRIEELSKIASNIFHDQDVLVNNKSKSSELHHIFQVGASAGGRRPKAIVGWNSATGEICSGQLPVLDGFEHFLLKLDVEKDYPHGRVEYAYSLMAKDFGINMMETHLLENGRNAFFLSKRFDRVGNQKIHMQTLCGLAHYSYIDSARYGYEDAFNVFRKLSLPYSDFEQLFRIMCFNVFAKNQDDHTKNISFTMNENGQWRFAPAYDLTFTQLPNEPSWFHKHEMSINGKVTNITKEDLMTVGEKNNINQVSFIIKQCEDIIAQWENYATLAGGSNSIKSMIQKELRVSL